MHPGGKKIENDQNVACFSESRAKIAWIWFKNKPRQESFLPVLKIMLNSDFQCETWAASWESDKLLLTELLCSYLSLLSIQNFQT